MWVNFARQFIVLFPPKVASCSLLAWLEANDRVGGFELVPTADEQRECCSTPVGLDYSGKPWPHIPERAYDSLVTLTPVLRERERRAHEAHAEALDLHTCDAQASGRELQELEGERKGDEEQRAVATVAATSATVWDLLFRHLPAEWGRRILERRYPDAFRWRDFDVVVCSRAEDDWRASCHRYSGDSRPIDEWAADDRGSDRRCGDDGFHWLAWTVERFVSDASDKSMATTTLEISDFATYMMRRHLGNHIPHPELLCLNSSTQSK